MNNDIYDVLKMQRKNMQDLLEDIDKEKDKTEYFNQKASAELEKSDMALKDSIDFLKNFGISVKDQIEEARKKAEIETNSIFMEMSQTSVVDKKLDINYEDLVKTAHLEGYTNFKVQDFLSEQEIQLVDSEYKRMEIEFREKTKLKKIDMGFLGVAIGLQAVRQYILDPVLKKKRSNAGAKDENAHGKKSPGWYRVPTEEILQNTVPFDAIRHSDNETIKDFLKGQKNHRDVTLGHDPVLGWVFGTANIMTGTITNNTFSSAHVKYQPGKGNIIYSQADTIKIFSTVMDRVLNEGIDGKKALAYALIREGIHLKSDLGTTHSLPLPGINVLNPQLGAKLVEYGIDTASVGTEAALSILINLIISMVHRIIKPEGEDEKLYAVRTRKILLISNMIASTSNVLLVGLGSGVSTAVGNPQLAKKSLQYLDVGGLLVTITRLFSDPIFIKRIEEEFINTQIDKQWIEEINRLDSYLQD